MRWYWGDFAATGASAALGATGIGPVVGASFSCKDSSMLVSKGTRSDSFTASCSAPAKGAPGTSGKGLRSSSGGNWLLAILKVVSNYSLIMSYTGGELNFWRGKVVQTGKTAPRKKKIVSPRSVLW